ncbi:DUF3800 domain-containing protein [candidate division WOR-3 bacterium]|nr:DUF3800 domain-containing protein [candidate division WOR-3 bacterium]
MYIGYVDESGFVGRNRNPNQPVQAMACIMANTYTLHRTLDEFAYNLRILRENNIPLAELKAEEIYRGRGAWQTVDGHIRHEIFTRYLNWLVGRRHFIILSLIDNNKFFDLKASRDELGQALEYPYIAGAMHIALAAQRANQCLPRNKGKTLLIFDEQPQFKQSVETLIAQPPGFTDCYYGFRSRGRTKLNQIIDTAYFVTSDYSYVIQIADVDSHQN